MAEVCSCGCMTFSSTGSHQSVSEPDQSGIFPQEFQAYLNTSMNVGCRGHESKCRSGVDSNMSMNMGKLQGHKGKKEVWGCVAYSGMSTNMGHQGRKSGREVDHESSLTHYALNWGPEVALRLSDDLALPLRVAHTMIVLRGGEGALASGAETHLVEPVGSSAFDYPHPPRVAGLDSKEDFESIQTVLESAPRYFSWYLSPYTFQQPDTACMDHNLLKYGLSHHRKSKMNIFSRAKTEAPRGGLQMKEMNMRETEDGLEVSEGGILAKGASIAWRETVYGCLGAVWVHLNMREGNLRPSQT
ncbi:hypothetical protein EDD15DRAFT_2201676 [Pisolithus albus]|nr:hypothetical protein EDD15DRAFT_2201676 [Pisolithus albus]